MSYFQIKSDPNDFQATYDLPGIMINYPDHEFTIKKRYFVEDDDSYDSAEFGSYEELCHELQNFINSDCFAVTVENDKLDAKYKGIIPGTYYKFFSRGDKKYKGNIEIANKDSYEILFNSYFYRTRGMTYQQQIMNNVIRDQLSSSIHYNFLSNVIHKNRLTLIKIYMFSIAPFALHLRYDPNSKSFGIEFFRSGEHLHKFSAMKNESASKSASKFAKKSTIDPIDCQLDNDDHPDDGENGDSLPIPARSAEELNTELDSIVLSRHIHLLDKMIDF